MSHVLHCESKYSKFVMAHTHSRGLKESAVSSKDSIGPEETDPELDCLFKGEMIHFQGSFNHLAFLKRSLL